MEVKADAQLGSHQRGVAQPAARASEVARKRGGSRLVKRTTFLTNTVLSIESYRFGREADLSPLDFALGWGPMSDPAVLQELEISQGNRWYQYRWKGNPPIEPAQIAKHSANTHLIPASDDVRRTLAKVEKGSVVRLAGSLVNVEHPDGWRWRSSTSRDDTGGGSCELLWVTEASVE